MQNVCHKTTIKWALCSTSLILHRKYAFDFHQIRLQHLWVCISMDSAVPHGSQDMLYSLVPWLALCNGLPSLLAPGPNWTSPVKNLRGSICMGPLPQTVTGVYPNVMWSLQCTSQRAKSPEPRRKPTDSWLASLRHITNAQKSRADRCLYSAHLAAVPWDAH